MIVAVGSSPGFVGRLDRRFYRAVARVRVPWLDVPLRELSRLANESRLWLAFGGLLVLFGGRARRAGLTGVAAIGASSLIVNVPMKLAGGRRRPDRAGLLVPAQRWVPMPGSTSFPSGHAASAAAFAMAVGTVLPPLRWPLRVLAAVVGFSRVYVGVHYPSDVLAGATVGATVGTSVGAAVGRALSRSGR